jgi:hypothetical protein
MVGRGMGRRVPFAPVPEDHALHLHRRVLHVTYQERDARLARGAELVCSLLLSRCCMSSSQKRKGFDSSFERSHTHRYRMTANSV